MIPLRMNGNTDLSSLPLNLGGFWGWVTTFVQVELFWQDLVFEVWIFIKVLKKRKTKWQTNAQCPTTRLLFNKVQRKKVATYKIYSVTRFDVLKLCDLHPGQVMKGFFILLTKQSWNCSTCTKNIYINTKYKTSAHIGTFQNRAQFKEIFF